MFYWLLLVRSSGVSFYWIVLTKVSAIYDGSFKVNCALAFDSSSLTTA